MGRWQISAEQLRGLMGPGASVDDARDMADLLTVKGYTTVVGPNDCVPFVSHPIPERAWDECLMALMAIRSH